MEPDKFFLCCWHQVIKIYKNKLVRYFETSVIKPLSQPEAVGWDITAFGAKHFNILTFIKLLDPVPLCHYLFDRPLVVIGGSVEKVAVVGGASGWMEGGGGASGVANAGKASPVVFKH